jgi:hypothetical protein
MVNLDEYLAYLNRDKERIEQNFSTPDPITTYLQVFNEEVVTSHISTLVEKATSGASNWSTIISTAPGSPFLDYGRMQIRDYFLSPQTGAIRFGSGATTDSASPGLWASGGQWVNFASGQSFTAECWFNASYYSPNSAKEPVTFASNTSGNLIGWELALRGGSVPEFQITDEGLTTEIYRFMGINAADNKWHHMSCGRNVASGSIFLTYDGVYSGGGITANCDGSIMNISEPWSLGRRSNISSSTFSGSLQEFRISNIARYTTGFNPSRVSFSNDANTNVLAHFCESGDSLTFLNGNTSIFGSVVSGASIIGSPILVLSDFPRYITLGSSTISWNGSQTNLMQQTGSFLIASYFSDGIQIGSYQGLLPLGSLVGSNITEIGLKSIGSIYTREVVSGFNIDAGSIYRFTIGFRIGS